MTKQYQIKNEKQYHPVAIFFVKNKKVEFHINFMQYMSSEYLKINYSNLQLYPLLYKKNKSISI